MPFVRIEIIKGQSQEYKTTMLQAVHDALVTALGIPDDDRNQRLIEIDAANFEHREIRTDKYCIIELTLFPGRSREMKAAVIAEITRLLGKRLGVPAGDVYIMINEPPLDNWGLRGVQGSELGLDYKKD